MAARPGRPSSTSCSSPTSRTRARGAGGNDHCIVVRADCDAVALRLFRHRPEQGRGPDGRCLRDNHDPRDFPNWIRGVAKRAWGAQLNSFESLPGFAPAVIIAHLVRAPQHPVDALAHGLGRGAGLCGVLPGRQGCAAVGGAVPQPGLRTWVFRRGRSGVSGRPAAGAGTTNGKASFQCAVRASCCSRAAWASNSLRSRCGVWISNSNGTRAS